MMVACVQKFDEIESLTPDVVVFPEYSELAELTDAASMHPNSMIVGGVLEKNQASKPRHPSPSGQEPD